MKHANECFIARDPIQKGGKACLPQSILTESPYEQIAKWPLLGANAKRVKRVCIRKIMIEDYLVRTFLKDMQVVRHPECEAGWAR